MTDIRTWKIYTYGVGICMYMYVYSCICMYIAASTSDHCTNCLQVRICMYMYVYQVFVCTYGICSYCARICMYFLESHLKTRETMPRPPCTVSRGGNRRATLRAPLGIWASTFFRTWQMLLRPDLAHPTPRHASTAPEASLPLAAGRSPMHDPRTTIQSRDLSHQFWLVGAHPDARGRRPPPLQNTSW